MTPATLFIVLLALSGSAYYVGRRRAYAVAGDASKIKQLHSRPTYYGALTAIWCGIPALLLFGFWLANISRFQMPAMHQPMRSLRPTAGITH